MHVEEVKFFAKTKALTLVVSALCPDILVLDDLRNVLHVAAGDAAIERDLGHKAALLFRDR